MTTAFDVVFLSYDEPLADELYARLVAASAAPVMRLHGVRGMRRAYQLTAQLAETDQYFLVDADFEIDPQFRLDEIDPLATGESMRVWQTINAVNGLVYGYGGLKLCLRKAVSELGAAVDVLAALQGRTRFLPVVAGRTRFNQSPWHAWRAGFRECAMLSRGCEYGTAADEARFRIDTWVSGGTGDFADQARAGACAGVAFATATAVDNPLWDCLNDPAWLADRYAECLAVRP